MTATCIAVTAMGVQTLNVIYRISGIRAADTTPMEDMAAELTEAVMDADDLPDVESDE